MYFAYIFQSDAPVGCATDLHKRVRSKVIESLYRPIYLILTHILIKLQSFILAPPTQHYSFLTSLSLVNPIF